MAYFPNVNDKLVLTQNEIAALVGTSAPAGDKQINSLRGNLIRGNKLSITDSAYLYGVVRTELTLDQQITTTAGKDLVLNPSGLYIDCTNHTLINVAGITSNANRYEVVGAYVTTTDATPTLALSIPTITGYVYSITVDIAVADLTDGVSSGGMTITTKSKNASGSVLSVIPYIRIEKGADASVATITATYTDSGSSVEVLVTGVAATTLKWLAAASVTRSTFL